MLKAKTIESPLGLPIRFSSVSKRVSPRFSIQPLNFDVLPGEFLTLLGPSGSGKSTVLGLVGGWVGLDTGAITIGSLEISKLPIADRPVRTCFQKGGFLFPHLTVEENIAYPLKVKAVPRRQRLATAWELLDRVGLPGLGRRRVSELSGGEAQRVAIARAIADPQPVLLLDEIETGLDRRLKRDIRELLLEVTEERQCTVIYVTHDSAEALALSSRRNSRVAVLNSGAIEQLAKPYTLYRHPATSFVAALTGEVNLLPIATRNDSEVITRAGNRLPLSSKEPGIPAYILLRPEWLSVAPRGGAFHKLRGTITSVEYLGNARRVYVDVKGDLLQVVAGPDERMAVGENLTLGYSQDRLLALER
jgi:putative spermidine/putrescine transport system ATP-binding protein